MPQAQKATDDYPSVQPMLDDTLRGIFEEEAAQELAGIEALLPTATDPAAVGEIYRHAHTIKGSAAVMGFDDVSRMAKALEAVFDAAREGQRPLAEADVPVIRAVVDDLRYVVSGALADLDVSATVADALSALSALSAPGAPVGQAPQAPAQAPPAPASEGIAALVHALARAQLALMRHALPAPDDLPEYAALRELLEEPQASSPGRRALVVEDGAVVREHHRRILADAGYDVRVAEDGAEALELLDAWPIDVVVTDVEMPRVDGIALTQAIRDRPALESTRVVIVTSRADEDTRRLGADAGADDYLVKRVDAGVLLASVGRALGGGA